MRSSIHFEYRLQCAMLLYPSTRSHMYAPRLLCYHSWGLILKAGVPHTFKDIPSFHSPSLRGTPLLDRRASYTLLHHLTT